MSISKELRKPNKFSLSKAKEELVAEISDVDKKTLARWAIECANQTLHYLVLEKPEDEKPKEALRVLDDWIKTGTFRMSTIRKASLDSHSVARNLPIDSPARSAARACGQAVATVHVKTHSIGAAIYAQQAVFFATNSLAEVNKLKKIQLKILSSLKKLK